METQKGMTRREFLSWLFKGSLLAIILKILGIVGVDWLLSACAPDQQETSTDTLLTLTEYRTEDSVATFLEAAIKNLGRIFQEIREYFQETMKNKSSLLGGTTGETALPTLAAVGLLEAAADTTTYFTVSLPQRPPGVDELTNARLLVHSRLAKEVSGLSDDPVLRLAAGLNLFRAYSSYLNVTGEKRNEEIEKEIYRLATIDNTSQARGDFFNRVEEFERNLLIEFLLRIFCDPFFLIKLKENAEELRRKISIECWDNLFTVKHFLQDFKTLQQTFKQQGIGDFLEEAFKVFGGIEFNQEFTTCVDEGVASSSFWDLLQKTLSDSRSAFTSEEVEKFNREREKKVRGLKKIWGVPEEEVDRAILSSEEIITLYRDTFWLQRVANANDFLKESLKVGLRQALRIIRELGGQGANFLGVLTIEGFSLAMRQIVDYLDQAIRNNNITQETLNEAAKIMNIDGGGETLGQYIKEFSQEDFDNRDFKEKLFEALIRELVDEVVERAFLSAERMFSPFFIKSFSGDRLRSSNLSFSIFQPLFYQEIPIFDPEVSSEFYSKTTYLPDLRIIKDPRVLQKILFGTTADRQPLVNGGILVNLSIQGRFPFGVLIPTNFFANFSQKIGSTQQEEKNGGASDLQLTNYNLVTDVEVNGYHLHIPLQSEVTLGGEGIPLQFIGIIYMAMEEENGSLGKVQPCLVLKDKLGGVYISTGSKVEDVLKIKSLNIEENVSEYCPYFVTDNGKKGYFLNLPEGIYNRGLMPVYYQAYTEIKRILKGDEGDMLWRLLFSPRVTQENFGYLLWWRRYVWIPTSNIVPRNLPAPNLILIREINREGEVIKHPIGVGPDFPLPLITTLQTRGKEEFYVVGMPSLPDSDDPLINTLKKIFGHRRAFVVVSPNQGVPVEDRMDVKTFLFRNKATLFFLASLLVEMGFRATALGEILLKAGVGTGILDLLLLKILIEAKGLH